MCLHPPKFWSSSAPDTKDSYPQKLVEGMTVAEPVKCVRPPQQVRRGRVPHPHGEAVVCAGEEQEHRVQGAGLPCVCLSISISICLFLFLGVTLLRSLISDRFVLQQGKSSVQNLIDKIALYACEFSLRCNLQSLIDKVYSTGCL